MTSATSPAYALPLRLAVAVLIAALVVSGLAPYDRLTWVMETAPIMIALPIMLTTGRRFPLTPLLYGLIAMHGVILAVGGAYTYARVPLGFALQDWLHLARNPYDKLGHLAQGFVPALVAREILLRGGYVTGRRMAAFLSLCVVMFVSANYELIEWWSALAMGQGADEFLGTQGDPWDTQSDMFCALIGGSVALFSMSTLQDRQIARMRRHQATS